MSDFRVGDRVVIARGIFPQSDAQGCWHVGSAGLIVGVVADRGAGYCGEHVGAGHPNHGTAIKVRWDSYGDLRYRSKGNSHSVCTYLLDLELPLGEDEIAEALRSIQEAIKGAGS